MVTAVKSFVKWLHVEDLIPLDIGHGVTTPRLPRLQHHLTDPPSRAEIRILLHGGLKTPFPERRSRAARTVYATGIQNFEACGIMPEDFEPPDVLIVRGKGNVERRVIYGHGHA